MSDFFYLVAMNHKTIDFKNRKSMSKFANIFNGKHLIKVVSI